MKQFVQFFLLMTALVSLSASSFAQTRVIATTSRAEMNEFVVAAKETNEQIILLLPAVQNAREAATRNLATVMQKASTLAQKVERAGSRMTETQYKTFQKELAGLEAQLDKIAAGGSSSSSTGKPAPGTSGECHGSCHDTFGDGFGGGKGWNRFWCKLGCFKIKVGPVSTGG